MGLVPRIRGRWPAGGSFSSSTSSSCLCSLLRVSPANQGGTTQSTTNGKYIQYQGTVPYQRTISYHRPYLTIEPYHTKVPYLTIPYQYRTIPRYRTLPKNHTLPYNHTIPNFESTIPYQSTIPYHTIPIPYYTKVRRPSAWNRGSRYRGRGSNTPPHFLLLLLLLTSPSSSSSPTFPRRAEKCAWK